jgi:hypothetical protein
VQRPERGPLGIYLGGPRSGSVTVVIIYLLIKLKNIITHLSVGIVMSEIQTKLLCSMVFICLLVQLSSLLFQIEFCTV